MEAGQRRGQGPPARLLRDGGRGGAEACALLADASTARIITAARNLLTPNRLALLRAIRTRRPGSIYELAKIAGRDLKNVQDDLRLLERYGLVRMSHGRSSGKRKVRIPQAVFNEISLKIAI